MPGGDRTGPTGMGPMTGRVTGFCQGFGMPGYMNITQRRSVCSGFGRGGGRGHRNRFFASGLTGLQRNRLGYPVYGWGYGIPNAPAMAQQQELYNLKEQSKSFECALFDVKKRIVELETGKNNGSKL